MNIHITEKINSGITLIYLEGEKDVLFVYLLIQGTLFSQKNVIIVPGKFVKIQQQTILIVY